MARKGFTLVEVVISMVIIAIVMYAVIAVFVTSGSKGVNVEVFTVAQSLAEGKLEEVMALPFASIAAESDSADLNGYKYSVKVDYVEPTSLDTVASSPPTEYKRIIVEITHDKLASPVTLESVRADY